MKKITLLLFTVFCFSFGFSQTFTDAGGPYDMQNGNGNTGLTCGTVDELNLPLNVASIGMLGVTNSIESVNVNITHTWNGDVRLSLVDPTGTVTLELINTDVGGLGNNFLNCTFIDGGATLPVVETDDITGNFTPQGTGGFASFNTAGISGDGNWTLFVCDNATGDTGTLDDWSITFGLSPACPNPAGIVSTPTSTTDTTVTWSAGGTETDWNYEWGVTGFTQGLGTTGSVSTTPSLDIMGLTAGVSYDIYIQADCGGPTSAFVPITWTQPDLGESCGLALATTVVADCSVATPVTLDFDAGGTEFLTICDGFGNNGYWITATTTVSGAININISGTATGLGVAIFDACGGNEVFCNNNVLGATNPISGFMPSTTYYFYFWQDVAAGTADICLEDISCLFPTALSVNVTTTTDAEISWTPGNAPPETAWEYVVQAVGAGAPAGAGTPTTSNPTTVTVVAGSANEFYVRADCGGTFSDWSGPFAWTQVIPPANDDLCNPQFLVMNVISAPDAYTNVGATGETGEVGGACFNGGTSSSVWFSFMAPASGEVRVSTDFVGGTLVDTEIAVYAEPGDCLDASTLAAELGCDQDSGVDVNFNSIVDILALTPGTTYLIQVDRWGTATDGTFGIQVLDLATLSTTDFETNGFKYFPNPVTNDLTLSAQNNIQNVTVYNMLGQQVLTATPNAIESKLDMSGLSDGAYFVKVTINNSTETIRVIKN